MVLTNESGHTITGFYAAANDVDVANPSEWGENMLSASLESGKQCTWSEMAYKPGMSRTLIFTFADNETQATFYRDENFDNEADPTNLTYTIRYDEEANGFRLTHE